MVRHEEPVWQLQDAKNRFSEVVTKAATVPQIVTRRGEEAVVVLGIDAYRTLLGKKKPMRSLKQLLLDAPKIPGGLDVVRDRSPGRKVELK
jgi:prevent-host-death family protein